MTDAWYIAGKIFLAFAVLAVVVFAIWGDRLTHLPGKCLFYGVTGLYCPGCGGTRSFDALIHGHLVRSFLQNPFVPYTFIVYIVFMINTVLVKHTKKLGFQGFPATILIYVGIGILLTQCIVRNVLLKCWGITCL